jgi:16S rRNA (cytosine1402-N4)-methyltransferase
VLVGAGARVLAVDCDPAAVEAARGRFDPHRVSVLRGHFADPGILQAIAAFQPDFILLDLGMSSTQLEDPERGFSFRPGIRLDMRLDSSASRTAAEVLNTYRQEDLARLFAEYGDEPRARRLARAVVRRRQRHALTTSDDLVNAIREALGPRAGPGDFARLFQAVRIEVNQELQELTEALPAMRDALSPGGILAVISYHSGEDRVVKHAFAEWARACVCPPRQPVCTCRGRPLGVVATRHPIRPSAEEVAANPRARSARLRVFVARHAR